MKRMILAAAGAIGLLACGGTKAPGYTPSAGSLALSSDDRFLYAVDTDNAIVGVIDTEQNQLVAQVPVGNAPARVVVDRNDNIYVSNRGDRSVSVIHRGTWSEAARIPVGVEPVGLAVSADAKTLYVVNATTLDAPDHGSVMAIDTLTLQQKWEQPVGEEPRGIRLIDENTAAVTLFKQGEVVFVDLKNQSQPVTGLSAKIYGGINASSTAGSTTGLGLRGSASVSTFHQRVMPDLTVSPDGKRIYVPTLLDREDPIAFPPSALSGGYYQRGGPCSIGAIATPGLITIDAVAQAPKVDDLTSCSFALNSNSADFPPTTLSSPITSPPTPIQGPTVAVVDPTGAWLFVVNRESNNVAVLPTSKRTGDGITFDSTGSSVRDLIHVGQAPDGIALTSDGTRAYVYSQFDHTVTTLMQDTSGPIPRVVARPELTVTVAHDPAGLSADFLNGRRHFFDATDSRMNNPSTGVSCNTCHVEGGREDGHTWEFPDGPRQTPSLAGRMILETAPYHWSGAFPDLNSFLDHTIQARMGGTGLMPAQEAELTSYVAAVPLPDNPVRFAVPTEPQRRGAQIFVQAGCDACHAGQAMTNNGFANVGTMVQGIVGQGADDPSSLPNGFNVPSLLGLGRTAPYLHDGSADTLLKRIQAQRTTNQHGQTSNLSDAQIDDLVAYLQSL